MKIGVYTQYLNYHDWPRYHARSDGPQQRTDQEIYDEELALADLVEPLGFDSYWAVDHYSTPYAMTGGVLQHLAHIVGRTKRIDVGTMVLVLPWYNPVQMIHQVSALDNVLQGRKLTVAVGRGAAVREFDAMRVPMGDARGRYDEALEIMRLALTQEWFEYDGEHFKIPRTTVRPKFRNPEWILENMKSGWSSPESLPLAARAGLGMLLTNQKSWQEYREEVLEFNKIRAEQGWGPLQPTVSVRVACFDDESEAWDVMRTHNLELQRSATMHYQLDDAERFAKTKGYEQYAKYGKRTLTDDQITANSAEPQGWGTPDQVFEKLKGIQARTTADQFVVTFKFGGMPADVAERSMRLFAEKVLPRLHSLDVRLESADAEVVAGR